MARRAAERPRGKAAPGLRTAAPATTTRAPTARAPPASSRQVRAVAFDDSSEETTSSSDEDADVGDSDDDERVAALEASVRLGVRRTEGTDARLKALTGAQLNNSLSIQRFKNMFL